MSDDASNESVVDLQTLVGREFDFFGVADSMFKLDGTVYEAVEDDNDGYRSALDRVRVLSGDGDAPFFRAPVARVRMTYEHSHERHDTYGDGFELWRLVDGDGHVWLEFGTENIGDYYPGFMFRYTPKEASA